LRVDPQFFLILLIAFIPSPLEIHFFTAEELLPPLIINLVKQLSRGVG